MFKSISKGYDEFCKELAEIYHYSKLAGFAFFLIVLTLFAAAISFCFFLITSFIAYPLFFITFSVTLGLIFLLFIHSLRKGKKLN